MDSEKTVTDVPEDEVQDDAVYDHHIHDAAMEWKAAQRRAGHDDYVEMDMRSTAKEMSIGLKNVTKKNMALKDFYEQVLVGVDPRERCATLLLLESLHVWRGDATENCPVLDVTHAAVLASVLLNVMDKQRASLVGKYDYRAYVAYVAADAGIGKTNTIIPTLNGIIPVSKMCAQREGEACVLTELTSMSLK